MIKPAHLDAIRRFEGFSAEARWDHAQHTNGYGTRALHPGEVIDKAEAERRFAAAVGHAMKAVERFAPGIDAGSLAALTSLTFNAGSGWMKAGLGDAVKAGDLDAAREILKQYVHAGGQRLQGLVARREAEAQWLGNGDGAGSSGELPPVDAGPAQAVVQQAVARATVEPGPAVADDMRRPGRETDDKLPALALAGERREDGAAAERHPGGMAFADALAIALLAIQLSGRAAPQALTGRDEAERHKPG